MKIESIRQVKSNLNQIVRALAKEGSVVITKNGRPCAVLMPVTEDTDLEIVAQALLADLRPGRREGGARRMDPVGRGVNTTPPADHRDRGRTGDLVPGNPPEDDDPT